MTNILDGDRTRLEQLRSARLRFFALKRPETPTNDVWPIHDAIAKSDSDNSGYCPGVPLYPAVFQLNDGLRFE
jgi:hypothetical protein